MQGSWHQRRQYENLYPHIQVYMTTEKPLKEHIIFSKATAWKLASGVVMTPKSVSGNEHEARH